MPIVEIPYTPRSQFVPFHDRNQRFSVGVAHRRAGKTVAAVNDLLKAAVSSKSERPRFAYIAPFFRQAKQTAWDYLKHYSAVIPGAAANEAELRIDFPHNGSRVQLFGADNYNAMRGLYFDGVVLDEYGDMDPRAWTSVIRPALADRQGWAVFIGTPRGQNHFRDVTAQARAEGWHSFELKASQTGLIPDAELRAAKRDMSDEEYAAEFECSFDAPLVGSYYGRIIAGLERDKQIASVPYDPAALVHTAWDLGIGDSTAIWFVQQVGKETHVIDYIEASGESLGYYAGHIHDRRSRGWVFGDHLLPHDASARELGTGKTREETLRGLGIAPKVLPLQSVDDGINAARMLLPGCWFDKEKCARGLEALRNYRREFDEKRKVFSNRPLHDWASHGADAFRCLAQGLRKTIPKTEPLKYDIRHVV